MDTFKWPNLCAMPQMEDDLVQLCGAYYIRQKKERAMEYAKTHISELRLDRATHQIFCNDPDQEIGRIYYCVSESDDYDYKAESTKYYFGDKKIGTGPGSDYNSNKLLERYKQYLCRSGEMGIEILKKGIEFKYPYIRSISSIILQCSPTPGKKPTITVLINYGLGHISDWEVCAFDYEKMKFITKEEHHFTNEKYMARKVMKKIGKLSEKTS